MRLAVYTDYTYHVEGGRMRAERAFALFLAELAPMLDRVVVLGRLHPNPAGGRYDLGEVEYTPLPYYEKLTNLVPAMRGMLASTGTLWRSLEVVDCIWVLGPHPLGLLYALLALIRRRSVVLGVRQQYVPYIRSRHPGHRLTITLAGALEGAFRLLGRFCPVIVVGPAIAKDYRHARSLLEIAVSLVRESEISPPAALTDREYAGELRVLSVGRLETEKNPLALADILAGLLEADRRWRLVVCGEGPMRGELIRRLAELGVADRAELLGYVRHDQGLRDEYRSSHALLHVSWTEGLPQVLFEAFGARLPVVATAVGGIEAAVGDAALLIGPGDSAGAVVALRRIASDPDLRARLVERGVSNLRSRTLEVEAGRVAEFLHAAVRGGRTRRYSAARR